MLFNYLKQQLIKESDISRVISNKIYIYIYINRLSYYLFTFSSSLISYVIDFVMSK